MNVTDIFETNKKVIHGNPTNPTSCNSRNNYMRKCLYPFVSTCSMHAHAQSACDMNYYLCYASGPSSLMECRINSCFLRNCTYKKKKLWMESLINAPLYSDCPQSFLSPYSLHELFRMLFFPPFRFQ